MQDMSTPKNFKKNLEDEQEEIVIDDYQKITVLREQGNLSGAFFLARQLAAEGDEEAKILVKEIMEGMNDGN